MSLLRTPPMAFQLTVSRMNRASQALLPMLSVGRAYGPAGIRPALLLSDGSVLRALRPAASSDANVLPGH